MKLLMMKVLARDIPSTKLIKQRILSWLLHRFDKTEKYVNSDDKSDKLAKTLKTIDGFDNLQSTKTENLVCLHETLTGAK